VRLKSFSDPRTHNLEKYGASGTVLEPGIKSPVASQVGGGKATRADKRRPSTKRRSAIISPKGKKERQ